jgi:tetratricopeptide (TPR) repeat protein
MAVLDRQEIPKTLLQRDGELQAQFTGAIGMLRAFSLISIERGKTSFEIHRLVQISTRIWLKFQGEISKWQEEALKALAAEFPPGEYENWGKCQALSSHAQAVIQYTFTSDLNLLRAKLLHNLAFYDEGQGRYDLAYKRFSDALSVRKGELGPEHLDTLVSMHYVGVVLWRQGKNKEAEEIHRQVRELREKLLGPEHPDTLESIHYIALGLSGQGLYKAAEEIERQVLKLRKKVLGPEHPNTLLTMDNLASTLWSQGEYKAAEEMERQVLKLREKVLGPEHPNTLLTMGNLASTLKSQGEYKAAEEMGRQVLKLRENVLKPEIRSREEQAPG